MKLFTLCLALLLGHRSTTIVLIDTRLKKPFAKTGTFQATDYLNKKFPLYADDVMAVSRSCEKAARLVEHQNEFSFDTVRAERSFLILNTETESNYKVVTIRLVTMIEEEKMSFSFEIVKRESDKRKIQRRLLDIADYLSSPTN